MKRGLALLLAIAAGGACGGERSVQLGAVLPLTGEAEVYGQSIQMGVELAFTELERRSEERAMMTLSVVDSRSDPERAAILAGQLYDDGALAVIGGVTSVEALAMVPVADARERVLLSPSASNPELSGISRRFYRVFISDAREGARMASFAVQNRKVLTAALLATDDAYGRGVEQVFETEFERLGGQVLASIDLPSGPRGFAALVERAIALDPAAVYLAAYAEDIAGLLGELRAQAFPGEIYTTSAFASPEVIARVGAAADGVLLTQPVFEAESDQPRIRDFVTRFRAKYGIAPDLYAAHGYDAVRVLEAAVAADRDGEPSAFWRSLRELRDLPGVTGTIQFDERGDVQKFPRVYVVDGGRLFDFEREIEAQRRALLERLRELEGRGDDAE